MQRKKINIIFVLIGCMIFLSACSNTDLEVKNNTAEEDSAQTEINLNLFDQLTDSVATEPKEPEKQEEKAGKMSFDRDVSLKGRITDIQNEKIKIIDSNEVNREINLKANTKYFQIFTDQDGIQMNSRETSLTDLEEGWQVSIDSYNAGTREEEKLEALIVKVFIMVVE